MSHERIDYNRIEREYALNRRINTEVLKELLLISVIGDDVIICKCIFHL